MAFDRRHLPVAVPSVSPALQTTNLSRASDLLRAAIGLPPSQLHVVEAPMPLLPGTTSGVDPDWFRAKVQAAPDAKLLAWVYQRAARRDDGAALGTVVRVLHVGDAVHLTATNRAWLKRHTDATARATILPWPTETEETAANELVPLLVEQIGAFCVAHSNTRPASYLRHLAGDASHFGNSPSLLSYAVIAALSASPDGLQDVLEENNPEERVHAALDRLESRLG